MGIPLTQLQTWATRPDPQRSAQTYETVRNALDHANLRSKYSYDIYLQGSYANATNIRADSDVDVVIEMESTFRRNISLLPQEAQSRYESQALPGTHHLSDFKADVKNALAGYYGAALVSEGNKCLKVAERGNRLPIDVLPCQEYRLYRDFPVNGYPQYDEGVYFLTGDGRGVINYPKIHRKNGEQKQALTSDGYKQIVRAVKNARRKLLEDGAIDRETSPSYFVECLLYNVPDNIYSADLRSSYVEMLIWLGEHIENLSALKCQNQITDLFGLTPEQWDIGKASHLIHALIYQWNHWD